MMNLKATIRIVRPRQWVKNFFVFAPLFFGGALLDGHALLAATVCFVAWCCAASSVYCLNDIVDADADRRHPVKRHRPIASGEVPVWEGYVLMALLLALSLAATALLPERRGPVAGIVAAYWLLNVAYCLWLKNLAIIDVCVVAFGFVLRILAGGEAVGVALTSWLVLMTYLLTLFLSFAKRRDDVLRMMATGEAPRRNTSRYNLTFINEANTITASVTLVCYILYTVSPEVTGRFHTRYLYLTSILVLVGLLRYIQIAVVDKRSGDPTKVILKDRVTQAIVLAWLASFLVIIYA